MAVSLDAKVAVDIADSGVRDLFLQALTESRISASQPGEPASVIVKDGQADTEPSAIPVVQLWHMGRARKTQGAGNPFAATAARNFIGASPVIRDEDVKTTFAHLFERRFIGLQQLMPSPKDVVTWRENASATKHEHLGRLRAFLDKHQAGTSLTESLEFTFEEMFSNAVYNAPIDAAGVHVHAHKSRTEPVISDRPFAIEYRVDAQHVGISVRDAYGTLTADRILECLRRCYNENGAEFEEKKGGAGLGFFMMLQQATRLVVNVKARQFSEVIVLRRLNEGRRQFMVSTPTLNLCFVTGDGASVTSRRFARKTVRWPARILVNEMERAATILDISPRGAFIAVEGGIEGFAPNTPLTVVSHPGANQPPFQARARVCWVGMSNAHRGPGIGVEFVPPLNVTNMSDWVLPQA